MNRVDLLELLLKRDLEFAVTTVNRWLERGDGVAIYENVEFGHPEQGHITLVSFGSPEAQIESEEAPARLPDIGPAINWRYALQGTYRGEKL